MVKTRTPISQIKPKGISRASGTYLQAYTGQHRQNLSPLASMSGQIFLPLLVVFRLSRWPKAHDDLYVYLSPTIILHVIGHSNATGQKSLLVTSRAKRMVGIYPQA